MTQPPRRPALGRGLSALIPEARAEATPRPGLRTVPIHHVRPASRQPRRNFDDAALDDLAASIRENGLIQPIVVRAAGPDDFVIIAGERRWRASQRAGLHDVPVVLREANDAHAFELALIENIQREDLGPLEEAEAYRHLTEDRGLTQEDVAKRVGKDRTTVTNALRLLKLPTPIQDDIAAGNLSAGHARALLTAPDDASRLALARAARDEGWSVRETERRARSSRAAAEEAPAPDDVERARPASLEGLETMLRTALNAPVRLVHRAGKGRIEIRFHSADELERLVDLLVSLEGR
jgi:ParB family chromosome partitioning protein